MNTVFLLTGGNLGDRLKNLQQAVDFIAKDCGTIGKTSAIYQTAAWGFTSQPDFYNQAIELHTLLGADDLMQALLNIEHKMGRTRSTKMGPRTIDIDILLMNDMVYLSPLVTIPHPRMAERRFVLMPLTEIAAHIIHPVLHKTIHELLIACKDELPVYKI